MTETKLVEKRVCENNTKSIVKNETNLKNYKHGKFLWFEFETELKWYNITLLSIFHILFLYGVLTYSYGLNWRTLCAVIWFFGYGLFGGFGVTGGAHRYWTHRSYKANLIWRYILMCCFAASGQNTLYDWVRDHRVHHKYSETPADPHDATRGFFFAHCGWLMMKKRPEVIEKGREVDLSDVLECPVAQFHQRHFTLLRYIFSYIIPVIVPKFVWNDTWHDAIFFGGFARMVFGLNAAWLVNSAAHIWGNRPYDRRINPRENLFVSILDMGEGWHNYHHTFPWDYKAAEFGFYPYNWTTFWIDLASKLGWVTNRKKASQKIINNTIQKYGDGSHIEHHYMLEVAEEEDKWRDKTE
ncbi:acyl-CoA desaturase-like [Chrysoperla carnea]|uniref:acyl-CoA desaturase-like n=1 Tax=Chrysoperla carnea TaxID=189513 RepID=UPI001D098489|nr:acyl-CoA desaturase-like [Chrysoperla carnea]